GNTVKHVQGAGLTGFLPPPVAVSHSDDEDGSISFLSGSGDFKLAAMHRTTSTHPSSLFTLGKYVGFMDGANGMRLIDVTRAMEAQTMLSQLPHVPRDSSSIKDSISMSDSISTAGGGIAVARLGR